MSFSSVTVTHSFVNPDGTPASGSVAFRLNGRMTNGGVTIMPSAPVTATLAADGSLSQALAANDDEGTYPTGVSWAVTVAVAGASEESWFVTVPSGAGAVDLGALLPGEQEPG